MSDMARWWGFRVFISCIVCFVELMKALLGLKHLVSLKTAYHMCSMLENPPALGEGSLSVNHRVFGEAGHFIPSKGPSSVARDNTL